MQPTPQEILIVEDNPVTRQALRSMLQQAGFRTREAEDGAAALRELQGSIPALVLLDLVLPDTHGLQLIEQIRGLPGCMDVPVVACTGGLGGIPLEQLTRAGFCGLIEKPVEPARMLRVLRPHLPAERRVLPMGNGQQLLLVDSDEAQRLTLQKRLEQHGFKVATASDFRSALETLRHGDFFAVLVEVQLPEQDGFDLVLAIRNLRGCTQLPVLLLGEATPAQGIRELALHLGATDLLSRTPALREVEEALLRLTEPPQDQERLSFPEVEAPSRSERDLGRLLVKLENQLAINGRLSRHNARLTAQLDILVTLSEALVHKDTSGEVLNEILAILIDTEGFALGGLRAPDDLVPPGLFSIGDHPDHMRQLFASIERLLTPPSERLLLLRRSEWPLLPVWEELDRPSIQSLLAIPLKVRGHQHACLLVASENELEHHPESIHFVRGVASLLEQALALRQAILDERRLLEETQKQKQAAQEQALLMKTILDSLAEGVITMDVRTGHQHWNKAALRLLGDPPEGDWSQSWRVFHEDGQREVEPGNESIRRVLQGEESISEILRFQRRGVAGQLWLDVTARRLSTEKEGLLGGVLLFRDISEVRHSEEKIRTSRASWKALVEHAPDLILRLDRDGIILFSNRGSWGLGREELVGRQLDTLLPEESRGPWQDRFTEALGSGEGFSVEVIFEHHPQEGPQWGSFHLGPIREDQEIVGLIVVVRDTTKKKRTDEQAIFADRMASVGMMAAGVAHEINNPLTAISTNLELTRNLLKNSDKAPPIDEIQEMLGDAHQASERVRHIVRDLKIFSRAEEERSGPVDLQKVLEISIRLAWNEIRHRAVLVQDFSPVPHVQGNESRLSQVFLNLLVNAVQSIPSVGQAEQHKICVSLQEDPQGVRVVIQDTGLGIAPEVMQRLFTPFFTTKPIGEGTGLGLTICRRIIENHQGQLAIESTPGHGTVVSVLLPVARIAPAPKVTSLPPIAKTGHILVIDDEPIITTVVRRILGTRYTVETCNEASEALAWLEQGRHFDLILCDLMMPHMSGMDFHEEVSRRFPAQLLSIFFLTGGAFTQKTRAFLDSIPGRFLEKPFQSADLLRFVGEHVSLGLQR